MNSLLKKCPACGSDLIISEMSCRSCGIKINGNFEMDGFTNLESNDLEFIKQFILADGNITKMQTIYNENYLSIKSRLNNIKIKLGGGIIVDTTIEDLISSEDSKVVKTLKTKMLECGGKALMPVLKGDPVPFWLSSTRRGVESEGLKGFIFEWKIFDSIVKKAISLGGKMYRGDSAAQNGAKIGSPELPLTTIDGYISTEFYGSNIGSSTMRRSTYFSGILAWAGIVENHRSQGKGGFITVNKEYMDLEE
jgi:hypothetical protein